MKAAAPLTTLALAASVLAAREWDPLPEKRDVATIQMVISQASGALQTLDTTVKAFNGDDFNKLASDANNLKTVLVSSTQQIQATSPISAQDAITLQSSLSPVQTLGQSLVSDLIAKKPEIQKASLCQVVQQQTTDIGTSANSLFSATIQKVPTNLQTIATQLTSNFTGQLTDLSSQFAPGNCTNAAGGSAAQAGIAFGNGSQTSGSGSSSSSSSTQNGSKSAASTQVASAFGVILVAAASFMLL